MMNQSLAETKVTPKSYRLLINGGLELGASTYPVIDPSSGEPFAEAPDASRTQLDAAVAAARAAQPRWATLEHSERRDSLERFADALHAACEDLASVLTQEQGKPLDQARLEILQATMVIKGASRIEVAPKLLVDTPSERRLLRYRPLGVVGAITPWNVPVVLAAQKIAEALQAGNTMVLKPSPYTPLATLMMGELAARTLPPGILNILSGGNELGAWMTEHRSIDMITFTGSSATGKRVAAAAMTSNLKRIVLELGGNDAAIVLADADLQIAAAKLFGAAFANSGQICMAIKRIYVHESRLDELSAALTRLAEQQVLGGGFEPGVTLGPVQNKMQFDRVMELIEDARRNGAEFLTGGYALDRPGYFIAPTIVTGLSDGTRLVDEEQFGPVLPIMPFSDVEDAVARANGSRFGLSASVWTQDLAKAQDLASKLEAGTVWVNKHLQPAHDVPFGGAKESGLGRIMTEIGAKAYMEPHVIDLIAQS